MARGARIKVWPLPNGVKRPNENSQPTSLMVVRAVSTLGSKGGPGSKGGGQKEGHPS
jgi:hypothetical protein